MTTLEAATTLKATDKDLTQRAAYNIEVEIDSYRPIKNGEHLVLHLSIGFCR